MSSQQPTRGVAKNTGARASVATNEKPASTASDAPLRGTGDGVLSEPTEAGAETMKPAQPGEYVNPDTGEIGGPRGPEPTRYGDWEHKGRCSDF